jgi:hypothetical protein
MGNILWQLGYATCTFRCAYEPVNGEKLIGFWCVWGL